MKWLAAMLLIVGCGRIGFDEHVPLAIGASCALDFECGRCARCEGTCQVEPITDVFLGHRSLCYLGAHGSRWCTGQGGQGELGLGDNLDRSSPERIVGEDGWITLGLGYGAGRGIRDDGQVWQWGSSSPLPTPTGDATGIRALLDKAYATCTVHTDDTAECDPTGSAWLSIDVGTNHYCGVKFDHTLWCWGTDTAGDLGQGPTSPNLVDPTQVGVATDWLEVATGDLQSCAIKTDQTLWCWGAASLTGTDNVDTLGVPTQIGQATDWSHVASNYDRACAMRGQQLFCWGDDSYGGQIIPGPLPSAVHVSTPQLVPGTWDRFKLGGHDTCALATNGRWSCFGWNQFGQLGIGNTDAQSTSTDLCP